MNVLLTSVGRRRYLVDWFREALEGTGVVAACDMSPHAPGLVGADIPALVPSVNDPFYVDAVAELCREHNIDLVIPLHDLDVHYLALGASRLAEAGTRVLAPSPDIVRQCFDKLATAAFMGANRIPHPYTLSSIDQAIEQVGTEQLRLPVVVKPRWGSASLGIEYVRRSSDLRPTYERVQALVQDSTLPGPADDDNAEVLVQEYLDGEEYHLDIVNDLSGSYVCTLPKLKLRMRSGETDEAITVESDDLEQLGEKVGTALGHVGDLDADVIVADGVPTLLEMNPRFGGGYPFAHVAGANLPGAIVAWAQGRVPPADWLRVAPNVAAAKFERLAVVNRSAQIGANSQ